MLWKKNEDLNVDDLAVAQDVGYEKSSVAKLALKQRKVALVYILVSSNIS
jgi:hypothetical protein